MKLNVQGLGHVPSFKNNKMLARGKLITDPKKQEWMEKCIQSFVAQLHSHSRTLADATRTGPLAPYLIASLLPLDDSRQWIPEQHTYCEEAGEGYEGAFITIEKL